MTREAWKDLVLPYVEGTLAPDDRRRFEALLARSAACRAEVNASRQLIAGLKSLPSPDLEPAAARAFDAAVMERLAIGARQDAARTISVAARSRLARRHFEPLFAPIPSLIGLALLLVAGGVALTFFFGDFLIGMVGGGVSMAAGSLWNHATWLVQSSIMRVVDLVTIVEVARRMFAHARPWLEAGRALLQSHGLQLLVVAAVTGLLVTGTIAKVRQARRRMRIDLRS